MRSVLAAFLAFAVVGVALAADRMEHTALLILPEEVSSESPFGGYVEFRWDQDAPLRIETWSLKDGESMLAHVQVFDEHGREVQMVFPMSIPLIPTREREVRKGELVKLKLYLMGWPLFERGGHYYAIATFSSAVCEGASVRFTTKKRWFKVAEHASKPAF